MHLWVTPALSVPLCQLSPHFLLQPHGYSLQEIIFPSWRGEKLEKFLADAPLCDTVGIKNDHYYDTQEECRSCLMNLKGSSRGERSALEGCGDA